MNRDDAEEFTQSLGQIFAGSWQQIAWGERQGIPEALGLTTRQWVNDRLGGYVRLSIEERREAAKELTEEGMTQRQVADVLGVNQATVSRALDADASVECEDEQVAESPADADASESPPSRPPSAITKPDLGGGLSHPARFSSELLDLFRVLLRSYASPKSTVLDPFAGTGRIHELQTDGWETHGIELTREYADMHPDTVHGDACNLPEGFAMFDAIVTSPTYGNRLADSHEAVDPELRRSYTHDLGRPLDAGNSGAMHWRTSPPGKNAQGSRDYRALHERAWAEAVQALRPGGLFILNCCDHIRDGLVQPVTAWHCWALGRLGLVYVESRSVPTRKLQQGANSDLREQEQVHVFRRPA